MVSSTTPDFSNHFSIANIPFGVASCTKHPNPAPVTRILNNVVFLDVLARRGMFDGIDGLLLSHFEQSTLNPFAALGRQTHRAVRERLQNIITTNQLPDESITPVTDVTMHLPVRIEDFVDFSCVMEHIMSGTEIMTGKRVAPPAFDYIPLGPLGQFRDKSESASRPVKFGPSCELDYELEVACVIGKPVPVGERVVARVADDHIFGVVLLNDWSARDLQELEMVPMGPQASKNFGTTVSPWIITLDALGPFPAEAPLPRYLPLSPYLVESPEATAYSVQLQAEYIPAVEPTGEETKPQVICKSRLEWMNWSFRQMVAQFAVAGGGLNAGDLLASGTVSGSTDDARGCLYELTWGWKHPLKLQDGSERTSLLDGDGIRITAWAGKPGEDAASSGVGFGECTAIILPATPLFY
ncbi:hypothetical protein NM208_g567 [Fusarium decemcellulare]|uniref:Uncharacterized protein n=2 Tax=Fusarium decemcellulare TaxID=57161 RepID=A0ACC1SZ59_9HYPO|nr:hypothetical protein NM208_g746 [Fusarium decemcellulare]KAJ3549310.1 hypothetical protein NM208_g567 [Fusarium decemcellulare]